MRMRPIKPTIIDRLIFLRSGIREAFFIKKHITLLRTRNAKTPLVLKFAYPGNVQYHQLTLNDAQYILSLIHI